MESWTTMSFSNLTQKNEMKAIPGGVFNTLSYSFLELFLFEVIALASSRTQF